MMLFFRSDFVGPCMVSALPENNLDFQILHYSVDVEGLQYIERFVGN